MNEFLFVDDNNDVIGAMYVDLVPAQADKPAPVFCKLKQICKSKLMCQLKLLYHLELMHPLKEIM